MPAESKDHRRARTRGPVRQLGRTSLALPERSCSRRWTHPGVQRSVLFAPDNLLVRRTVRRYPERFVGYVWPNPHEKGALALVKESVKVWGFKGVKLHPLVHAFLPTDEEVLPMVEFAGKERIPVAIHSGHPPFSLPWSIGELAEMYPEVRIVMLHMVTPTRCPSRRPSTSRRSMTTSSWRPRECPCTLRSKKPERVSARREWSFCSDHPVSRLLGESLEGQGSRAHGEPGGACAAQDPRRGSSSGASCQGVLGRPLRAGSRSGEERLYIGGLVGLRGSSRSSDCPGRMSSRARLSSPASSSRSSPNLADEEFRGSRALITRSGMRASRGSSRA